MKKLVLILALCTTLVAVVGCDLWFKPDQKQIVVNFFADWLMQNVKGVARATLNWERDREAERFIAAVKDVRDVIQNLLETDRLMAQGQLRQDTDLMDEAIRRRPADWTYRSIRAAQALQDGDLQTYNAQLGQAQDLAADRKMDKTVYSRTVVNDLESVDILLRNGSGYTSRLQCVALYRDMMAQYASLDAATHDPVYKHRYDIANEHLQACPAQ